MTQLRNFHEGEIQLQRESGVDPEAYDQAVDQPFRPELNPSEVRFVGTRTFSVAASIDSAGRPWASPLLGQADELFTVVDPTTVRITPPRIDGDPFIDNVGAQGAMGVLYFDPSLRRRAKSLGKGTIEPDATIAYRMHRMFGICTKYIYKRSHIAAQPDAEQMVTPGSISDGLSHEDRTQLEAADTIFLASHSDRFGADPTHRGGPSGFVTVIDETTLAMPDFPGNGMFQTMGNLLLDDRVGLLSLDFETGRSLQVTGRGSIRTERDAGEVGRTLMIDIDEVRISQANQGTWTNIEAFDLGRVFSNPAQA